MDNLYSVLGLAEDAPIEQVKAAHDRLVKVFATQSFLAGSAQHSEVETCLESLRKACQTLADPDARRVYALKASEHVQQPQNETHPRIGQLCVASRMISADQLREAVETQVKTKLPLGEILLQKQFISAAQLEGLLLGQEMIDIAAVVQDTMAVVLTSLGLISEDMALVAQMEMRSQGIRFKDVVASHGWVTPEVLDLVEIHILSESAG